MNATGVFQHEPEYEILLERMIDLSSKYILFDVKFANTHNDIINIDKSYSESNGDRLYYILLNYNNLIKKIKSMSNKITKVDIFGYETKCNKNTHIPYQLKKLISAGVLITLGKKIDNNPVINNINLQELIKY